MKTPAFPTIAEAKNLIKQDGSLSAGRRLQLCTALNTLAKLYKQPAETIRLDPQKSIAMMEGATAAALRVNDSTFANRCSTLRTALRHLGLLDAREKPVPVTDPAWVVLLERLPEERGFERLRAFVSWLASQGIAPAAVAQPHLDAYLEHRQASRGGSKQVSLIRRLVGRWRNAANTVEGWPQAGLANPQPRQLSLPFDAYPAPLAEEAEKYLTDIAAPVDIFAHAQINKREPVRARTVKTRRHGVRALLWGAFQGGIPMERLNHLRTILELDVLKSSFKWHMSRKNLPTDGTIDHQLMSYVATIYSVANYYGVEANERLKLKDFLDHLRLEEPPDGLIDRHERILDELETPRTRAMLLHLPANLMKAARRLREGWTDKRGTHHVPRPQEAAWLAGMAVAVEIELHAPLRLTDLAQLRLGHELRLSGASSSRWIGTLHVERTSKTGKGIQVPLQPETIRLIREYLDHFRPLLRHASGTWLFPGEVSADRPRSISAFGTAISESTAHYVGLRVNPHAFRCIAGALILEANPHAMDDVRAILGHATFNTTLRYYRRFETRGAATRLGERIAHLRRDTSHLGRTSGRVSGRFGSAERTPRKSKPSQSKPGRSKSKGPQR